MATKRAPSAAKAARATGKATAKKAGSGRTRAPARSRRASAQMPPRVFAQASPRSVGGLPLFAASEVTASNVINFASEDHVILDAVGRLQSLGFEVPC